MLPAALALLVQMTPLVQCDVGRRSYVTTPSRCVVFLDIWDRLRKVPDPNMYQRACFFEVQHRLGGRPPFLCRDIIEDILIMRRDG